MRLAVAVTFDAIGRTSDFGRAATYDVMVDATGRAGKESM